MNDSQRDLRGVMIQVAGGRLLLPNASIAEILSVSDPEPIPGAPGWLLGNIRWRGWQLPLVSFSRVAGLESQRGAAVVRGQRALVLKALGNNPRMPYFAVVTQGFPRLVNIAPTLLDEHPDTALQDGVAAMVTYNNEDAMVPDLDMIETWLNEALAA